MAPKLVRETAPPERPIREPLSTITDKLTPIVPLIAAEARIVPCASQWSGELPSESARPIQMREPLGTTMAAVDAPIVGNTSHCSGTQLQQDDHQQNAYMSAALEFMWLVKTTVTSTVEYEAFLQVMRDYSRRSLSGDANAIKLDTILSVEELLQNYPLLITRFRAFRAQL